MPREPGRPKGADLAASAYGRGGHPERELGAKVAYPLEGRAAQSMEVAIVERLYSNIHLRCRRRHLVPRPDRVEALESNLSE